MRKMNKLVATSVVIICVFVFIFIYSLVMDSTDIDKDPSPPGVDFAVYYTAGQMAAEGNAEDIYDIPEHHQRLEKVLGRKIPFLLGWFYPPTYLLLTIPFSYIPYHAALVLWLVTTFLLAGYSIYLLIPKHKNIALLAIGFPGILMNLRWGQNGFLNTALLGYGLYFIDHNPILAGLMFGLLTYKPQIAFFPILLLLFTKKGKVLLWTIIFSIAFILISAFAFGLEPWLEFFNSFFNSSSTLLGDEWLKLWSVQPSFYSFFRMIGIGNKLNYGFLALIGIAVTVIVVRVWRKTNNLALKSCAMVLGILLTMPYYMQYDLMILSIPLVLLSYDCYTRGFKRYEFILLAMLWVMPLLNWPLVVFTGIQICPVVLAALLILTVHRTAVSEIPKIKG